MIGSTILHYKVLARIGQGGMGEVWVAEDTKLGRKVALEILPPELANDPDRRARFERFIAMVKEISADVDRVRRALAASEK